MADQETIKLVIVTEVDTQSVEQSSKNIETSLGKSAEQHSKVYSQKFTQVLAQEIQQPITDAVQQSFDEAFKNPITDAIKARLAEAFGGIGDSIGQAMAARLKQSDIFDALDDLKDSIITFVEIAPIEKLLSLLDSFGGNGASEFFKLFEKYVILAIEKVDQFIEKMNLLIRVQQFFALLIKTAIVGGIAMLLNYFGLLAPAIAAVTTAYASLGAIKGTSALFGSLLAYLKPTLEGLLGVSEAGLIASGVLKTLGGVLNLFGQLGPAEVFNSMGSAAGVAGLAIFYAMEKAAGAVKNLGTFIVDLSTSSTKAFSETEKSTILLTRAIENINRVFNNAAGPADEWNKLITQTSVETGIASDKLQKAASEIIFVGTQLGLTRFELEELYRATVDFSTITGDVVQASLDVSAALNGSSQSVIKYGIKLTEENLQQYAFKKGIDRTIASFEEQDKVLLRASKLLNTYGIIQGQASALADSFSGAQTRLESSLKRVNAQFGEGAAVIEGWNLAAYAADKILTAIPDTLYKFLGLLGAIIGRTLQFVGIMGEMVISMGFVLVAFKAVNAVLKLNIAQTLIAKIANDQLRMSMLLLSGTYATAGAAGAALAQALKLFIASITGASISLGGFAFAIDAVKMAFTRLWNIIIFGLNAIAGFFGVTLGGFIAIIVAIVAAVYSLVRVFKLIEQRTQAFSNIWSVFTDLFAKSAGPFAVVKDIFLSFLSGIAKLGRQALGILTQFVIAFVDIAVVIAKTNPFKMFSKEQIKKLEETDKALLKLSGSLFKVGNDIGALGNEAGRSIASVKDPIDRIGSATSAYFTDFLSKNKQFVIENKALFIEYGLQLGTLSQAQIDAIKKLSLTSQEQNTLMLEKTKETTQAMLDEMNKVNEGLTGAFVGGITSSIETLGAALGGGKEGFKDFGKKLLAILGDLAIQAGKVFLSFGVAILGLKTALKSLNPYLAIAAGVALIALGGALKGLSGGAKASGSTPSPSSSAPSSGTSSQGAQNIEERGPSVQLVVQGNILDRRQTGLELAQVIRESIGKGAVVYG